MQIQLFVTCLVDLVYPEVGERTVALLERLGCEVAFPAGQTCCGQPAYNTGYPEQARRVADRFVATFGPTEGPIVAPFGSCVHMVRHGYRRLYRDDPDVLALLDRVRDLPSFIVDDLGRAEVGGRFPVAGTGGSAGPCRSPTTTSATSRAASARRPRRARCSPASRAASS